MFSIELNILTVYTHRVRKMHGPIQRFVLSNFFYVFSIIVLVEVGFYP